MPPTPSPLFFKTTAALSAWFKKHGTKQTELWMGYYKKHTGKKGVVYQEALDIALCWGWIDGLAKGVDEDTYMQRWTPRKPTSIWSAVNVRKVERLIAEGLMQPVGLAAFERRTPERTGIYSFEQRPDALTPDFEARFRKHAKAWAFFEALPPGLKRTTIHYVISAKKEETRERRFLHVFDHAKRGERIPEFIDLAKRKAGK